MPNKNNNNSNKNGGNYDDLPTNVDINDTESIAEQNNINTDTDNSTDNDEIKNSEVDCDEIDGDNDNFDLFEQLENIQKPIVEPTTLDDIEDDKKIVTYAERVKTAMDNNPQQPCSRNKELDEKLSKYSTYACIPFFLISIIFSLFNIGKVRHPWSFLFLSLATLTLSVGAFLRYRNNQKCSCSLCETQGKTLRSSALIWLVASVGLMVTFIVMMVI